MKMIERQRDADVPRGTLAEVGRDLASRSYVRRGVPARTEPIRVVLVDDHELVRAGFRSVLHASPDILVVGEAGDGELAVATALRVRPELVVMDIDMPGTDGLTATRRLHEAAPDIHVLIVTMYEESQKLLEVLNAGARGYLSKGAAERDLADAIRVVASGDVYVRPSVARSLADSTVAPPRARTDALGRLAKLSRREQTVVILTAQGFNGPEIGQQLSITAKTVDTYKQRIEEKLGLSHRTQYVRFALDADLMNAHVA